VSQDGIKIQIGKVAGVSGGSEGGRTRGLKSGSKAFIPEEKSEIRPKDGMGKNYAFSNRDLGPGPDSVRELGPRKGMLAVNSHHQNNEEEHGLVTRQS